MKSKVFIGHRGVGKTSFLNRLGAQNGYRFFDLDAVIEEKTGLKITKIFDDHGESEFRKIEIDCFNSLIRPEGICLAVGAGFPVGAIPPGIEVTWLRRKTDQTGRIFLDRPRLLKDLRPIEEFLVKKNQRDKDFSDRADAVYFLPEGQIEESVTAQRIERSLFLKDAPEVSGIMTLLPAPRGRRALATPDFWEIRDDLLTPSEIKRLFAEKLPGSILYSVRTPQPIPEFVLKSECLIDWPAARGVLHHEISPNRLVISSHCEKIENGISELQEKNAHLKLCPLVLSWDELALGHRWRHQDPTNRSFLPRSPNGRWDWYRLSQNQKINFWREGEGSAPDQPTLFEWVARRGGGKFAAVLGAPVAHSFSSLQHLDYFSTKNISFFKIEVTESEFTQALPILRDMGLVAAAVTAPLKKQAFTLANQVTPEAQELGSVNTLKINDQEILGHNTDLEGLRQTKTELTPPTILWGGGGMITTVHKIYPQAIVFSSRKAQAKNGSTAPSPSPNSIIWAAPTREETQFPQDLQSVQQILDLNYAENSLGRELAVLTRAVYHSGLAFFKAQAVEQQKFWEESV